MSPSETRRYWIFSEAPINSKINKYQRELESIPRFPSEKKRARLRQRRSYLLDELKKLESRRFLDIGSIVIQEGSSLRSEKTTPLYLYSQESDVLEFFSKTKIGTSEVTSSGQLYLRGPYGEFWLGLPPDIYIDGSMTPSYAVEVDAATFASKVKPLLPHREIIARKVINQLNKIIKFNAELRGQINQDEAERIARNKEAERFLRDFI